MSLTKIACGIVLIAVSLGFVFPQLAEIRDAGALPPVGILLLVLGSVGTMLGLWYAVQGVRRGAARPTL